MSNVRTVATDIRAPLERAGSRGHGFWPRALDWAERRSATIERYGAVIFAGVSALYWLLTFVLARRKFLWNDELFTYYIATQPSLGDIWSALLTGAEQTPPLVYLATRTSFSLFGINNLSVRLPEMIGFWVMSACILVFVKRRTSWLPAICAAATPLVTLAYQYAFEARAYALVLGFSALALLCWQSATLDRHRLLSLTGLALSLSAAVSSHYYAVLVLMPFALGEATRTLTTRRIDAAVWATFAAPAVAVALHLPLVMAGRSYSGAFWSPPQWVNIPDYYTVLLYPLLIALVAILVAAVAYFALAPPSLAPPSIVRPTVIPPAEVAAALGFVFIPFACIVVAKLVTGAANSRYVLPAVIGFAVLAGWGISIAFLRSRTLQLVSAACLTGWFALSQAHELVEPTNASLPVTSATISRPVEWVKAAASGRDPVVVADPHNFLVLSHYGPADLKARLVYLSDPARALSHLGHNSVERGMVDLIGPWFHTNVVDFATFAAATPRFLIYGDFNRMAFANWIVPELQQMNVRLELLNGQRDYMLLRAERTP